MPTTIASGKVAPWSRNAHSTSPGARFLRRGGRASQCRYRCELVAVCRRRLDGDSVVLLVADQHASLTRAQQIGHDRYRNAIPLDLERAVTPAREDQDVAEAVAHQQVEQPGPAARCQRQPGGVFADRDAEGVLECPIAVAGVDPDLARVLHQYGQVEVAVTVEVAGHDRDRAVVDARTVAGRCGQGKRRIGKAAGAVGRQDGEAVRVLIDDHDIVAAVAGEVARDQADRSGRTS